MRKFIDFEICLVESSEAGRSVGTPPVGYEILRVTQDEFEAGRSDELLDREHGWSFDRDDQCIAALYQGKVVAFTFQTSFPTVVREGLEFEFPGNFAICMRALQLLPTEARSLRLHAWLRALS